MLDKPALLSNLALLQNYSGLLQNLRVRDAEMETLFGGKIVAIASSGVRINH
jgi:hypothetical protein